jgi:hypothetical protein
MLAGGQPDGLEAEAAAARADLGRVEAGEA